MIAGEQPRSPTDALPDHGPLADRRAPAGGGSARLLGGIGGATMRARHFAGAFLAGAPGTRGGRGLVVGRR